MSDLYRVNEGSVAWRLVDGEAVLINTQSSYYYSLNATGTFMWQSIVEDDHTLETLSEKVAVHYDMPVADVKADVEEILHHLEAESLLVRISDESR